MRVILGLGSNMGDREGHLRETFTSLQRRRIIVLRSASLYLTEPRDYTDQPWFINTVAEVETHFDPLELLECCLLIEREAGRIRDQSRGPRPIDLDILFFGDQRIQTTDLIVPHPRYAERRFVLAPLAEIAPNFRDPISKVTIQQLLAQCPDAGEVRLYAPSLTLGKS
jgi:2-amino-4-hydroxy-6-hydroxymethyldihydropteridine diphosphokinase